MDAKDSRSSTPTGGADRNRFIGDGNLRSILELVEAAIGENISRINTSDLRRVSVSYSCFDVFQVGDIILDHVHKRHLTVMLNR